MHDGGEALRARASALVRDVCHRPGRHAPLVVEAGCGARSHLAYPADARLLGIDMSAPQLRRNQQTPWRVQGDAMRLPVVSACADAAVSWDVLEHLPAPADALTELARVVRPGGLIVLGLPHALSLKGIVTRLTPWWVHVWVYRRILGDRSAGTDTSDQFPTTLRVMLRPAGLRRLARVLELEVVLLEAYEGPVPLHFRRRHPVGGRLLATVGLLSRVLSVGRYDATASDIVVVLRRREET